MRTTRRGVFALALLLTGLAPDGGTAPAGEVVPIAARGFALTDVRLLDGPFREAMLRDQQFLLSLDVDRLLHTFRLNAGLPSSATPLGGWEAPDVELRGHSVGHFLTASALMYASTGDARFNAIWTLAWTPCLTLPAGNGRKGLPLGVQLVGPRFGDEALLDAAAWVEARLN